MAAKKRKAVSGQGPHASIMLVCDAVARDPSTGKSTLYGVFDRVHAPKTPAHASFWTYARLVGGHGQKTISFQILDEKGRSLLSEPPTFSYTPTEGSTAEVAVFFREVEFPKFGKFVVAAFSGRQQVGSSYEFSVAKRQQS
ncbi:MAG: hypothetical protein HYS13_22290 [Planctomycetia bacterium]|nr:hypothetical protein [Planctomycetia bacterium]